MRISKKPRLTSVWVPTRDPAVGYPPEPCGLSRQNGRQEGPFLRFTPPRRLLPDNHLTLT